MEPTTTFIPEEGIIYLPSSLKEKLNGRVEFLEEGDMAMLHTVIEKSKSACEVDWEGKESLCKGTNCKGGCYFILAYIPKPTPHCEFRCICSGTF